MTKVLIGIHGTVCTYYCIQQQAAAAPAPAIQPAQQYLQQQQQLFMTQRNSIPQYLQQSQQASQQSFYTQQALMSGGGSAGLHMLQSSADRGGMQLGADNGPQLSTGFSDGGSRDGNQSTQQLGLRGEIHHAGGGATGGPDLGVSSPLGHRDGGSGQGGDDSEASYLKGSDASSLWTCSRRYKNQLEFCTSITNTSSLSLLPLSAGCFDLSGLLPETRSFLVHSLNVFLRLGTGQHTCPIRFKHNTDHHSHSTHLLEDLTGHSSSSSSCH